MGKVGVEGTEKGVTNVTLRKSGLRNSELRNYPIKLKEVEHKLKHLATCLQPSSLFCLMSCVF